MGSSDPPEGDIRIDIGPSSSSGGKGRIRISMRSWTNIVATGAALIAGVAAYAKPTDHSATKASYEELKKAHEETVQNDKQNHEDIVALRNYLEGYLRGHIAAAGSGPTVPTTVLTTGPTTATPRPSAFHPPPLPTLHSEPKPHNLPDFDKVVKK